jgi:HSP20 family protein
MLDLRRDFDRLFESALDLPQFGSETADTWGLALDIVENDDAYVVKASVPGINPDDLEITLSENNLTIRGEFKEEKDVEENRYHLRERRQGSFARSVTLPTIVERDAIEATYDAGVLTLRLPKAEEVKPKRINIQVQDGRKTLTG